MACAWTGPKAPAASTCAVLFVSLALCASPAFGQTAPESEGVAPPAPPGDSPANASPETRPSPTAATDAEPVLPVGRAIGAAAGSLIATGGALAGAVALGQLSQNDFILPVAVSPLISAPLLAAVGALIGGGELIDAAVAAGGALLGMAGALPGFLAGAIAGQVFLAASVSAGSVPNTPSGQSYEVIIWFAAGGVVVGAILGSAAGAAVGASHQAIDRWE